MKMQSFKIAAKRVAGTLLLTAAVFVSANAASLHEPVVKDTIDRDTIDRNATVISLGKQDNQFLYKVKYNNVKGGKFNVSVKDNEGYIIFQESYTDRKFDKLFKISQEEQGSLTFVIRNLKDNSVNTFSVNTNTRVLEEVMITKVN